MGPRHLKPACAGLVNLQWFSPYLCWRFISLYAQPPSSSHCPFDPAACARDATDLSAELLVDDGPPGHELQLERALDHRERS